MRRIALACLLAVLSPLLASAQVYVVPSWTARVCGVVASGRILFADASGNCTSDADLTFDGSILSVTDGVVLGTSGKLVGGTNLIQQRNSTSAQRADWANTWTSASSNEMFSVDWQTTANTAMVGTRTAASGNGRPLLLTSQTGASVDRYAAINLTAQTLPIIRLGYFTSALANISNTSAGTWISIGELTSTATSGAVVNTAISPTYNQASGTAANTDLLINRTQTAVGSGAQLLFDAQVGGASKFSVSNTAVISLGGVMAISGVAPTTPVACTSPAILTSNGTLALSVDVGSSCTGVTTLVLTFPAAANGWECHARHITTAATNIPRQTGSTTTSVTITNFSATLGTALDWVAGDDVGIGPCVAR